MKEAIVSKGPKVEIVDSPIPQPNDDQVLIQVVVSGSNPKDWKIPVWVGGSANQGDDIAGVVAKVGANVTEFKPGDRVAAFHEMRTPGGSYAEYAIAWQATTFHIPPTTSFEEASTLPLAALTAAVGLYVDLGLPAPWAAPPPPADQAPPSTPLIVYGASSAVGDFALQFAALSNIHPIIAVAGQSSALVESRIDRSKGDTVVDYRGGDEAAVAALKKAVGDLKVHHAYDAISEHSSTYIASQALQPNGKITLVLPRKEDPRITTPLTETRTGVGRVHQDLKDFGFVFSRYMGRALQQGKLKGHPHEVVPGGLGGIETALTKLSEGKAHGLKYVFRVKETEGAGQDKL
ncbi:groes-like alcohol dehydrogenase [Niveomyces insectorum RCEF 264]|uniref:Groes-like alcohol dehydrogenase n=1 Tax=Niveomyces insectorum RCEF 264 TaxID=1081102 RepID=A0A167N9Q4_9HYPO|nr:groes-like alcohol dehydrogenase [Niveomyces insectorum RCEF 264]